MNASDLALEAIQEGHSRLSINELYKQFKEEEALEEFMKQDTEGLNNLKKEMDNNGYSPEVSNSVLKMIEREQYYFDENDIGKECDVIKLVDIYYTDSQPIDDGTGRDRNLETTVLTFEDKDGNVFDVELNKYRDIEFDSDFDNGRYFLSDSFELDGRLV